MIILTNRKHQKFTYNQIHYSNRIVFYDIEHFAYHTQITIDKSFDMILNRDITMKCSWLVLTGIN